MKSKKIIRFITICFTVAMIFCFAGCANIDNVSESKNEETLSDFEISGLRNTVLYYPDDNGLIVPVMRKIPWDDGIVVSALELLVSTKDNENALSKMGLNPVMPEGVKFSVSIDDDKKATVDIKGMTDFDDAQSERNMVVSVVNTLTEFPSIKSVKLQFDGESTPRMRNGTDVSLEMESFNINVEDNEMAVSTGSLNKITLYYPNVECSTYIPVTRFINKNPDFENAVSELIKGTQLKGTRNCFPEGTKLLEARIVDDVATVNLSSEFLTAEDTEGLAETAYTTLLLTANEFSEISQLTLKVDGINYDVNAENTEYINMFR